MSGGRSRGWAATAAALAGLAVAFGAFGAHALAERVPAERLATFETAARYQFLHALALLVLAGRPAWLRPAAPLLLAGTLVFSGSLYGLVLTGAGALGAVAPVGGVLMILGWAALAWRAWRGPSGP